MLSKEQVELVLNQCIRNYKIVECPQWLLIHFNQCYVQFLFEENSVEVYDGIKNKWKLTYEEMGKQLRKCHKTGGFWDRNYNMLKELLSLAMADGECPQLALDLPFNEQVHIILQSHDIKQSDDEYEKTCITEDGFARIYASDLVIVIQPEEELMHIGMLKPNPETHTHGLPEWENMDAEDFPRGIYGYVWWTQNLKPALFEIIELLESPDTSGEAPPITCEETQNEEVAQLRKQVEELQGKNEDLERQLKELDELFETVRTSKNRTIKNLQDKHGDLWRRLNIYQFAHEEEIQSRMNSKKGVTSDS